MLVKQDATHLERAETALMQAQINRLFIGELIRNELDNDRDAWSSQADRLRQLVGSPALMSRSVAVHQNVARVARASRAALPRGDGASPRDAEIARQQRREP